ncbi:pentatricopeptide repeat-containing protein At1g80150, mitochondrial-like [Asparagus officinalis]|uniref:pentatricopeptide repeat-containing protein At1g80150, mitochondrial-like n=1 Tax=Asparagus officinalis TaxID=4686 RepID=UPI00098DE1BB|nr:pentatricopeptide repeat-containing protein At1g80150, mitochondrial-like [Asparagus officinalis]
MLSLSTVRRVCAAIDAVSATVIAAGLSKSRTKTDLSAAAASCSIQDPNTLPTIASCKAALLKKETKTMPEESTIPVSEPALVKIKKERDPEKLFHLFKSNAHNRLVVENRFAFEDTVSRLAGASRFDLIEQLLEHQKALPQGRREGFVVRIIMLYGRARMPDQARKTFDEMHLFGCRRTVKSLNATLKVLYDNRRFDNIQEVIEETRAKFGIEFDDISFNIIIKVLCEMGHLDDAYLTMVNMEKCGIKPDVVTYTTIMSACYKLGRREIGDGLWNLMVLRGCSPNLATYNVRIQYLISRQKAWQANSLIRKMDFVGIKPDELTYNLIIKGFCMICELEMAKRIFMSMHGRGCKPNSKIYQTMVHYLCKAGEFDMAFRLCKDSMERNWFPSVDTIDRLLKGLMSISKDRNAREIMKLVSERKPPYLKDELEAFGGIFSRSKTQEK